MSDTAEQIKKLQNAYSDIFNIKAQEQIEMAKSKKGIASDSVILEHLNIAEGLRWAAYYMAYDEFPEIH
jgi:hypothetical protein